MVDGAEVGGSPQPPNGIEFYHFTVNYQPLRFTTRCTDRGVSDGLTFQRGEGGEQPLAGLGVRRIVSE